MGQKAADVLQGGWIKPVDKRSKRGTGKNIEDWTTNYKEKIGRERKEDGEIEINERIQQMKNK